MKTLDCSSGFSDNNWSGKLSFWLFNHPTSSGPIAEVLVLTAMGANADIRNFSICVRVLRLGGFDQFAHSL